MYTYAYDYEDVSYVHVHINKPPRKSTACGHLLCNGEVDGCLEQWAEMLPEFSWLAAAVSEGMAHIISWTRKVFDNGSVSAPGQ